MLGPKTTSLSRIRKIFDYHIFNVNVITKIQENDRLVIVIRKVDFERNFPGVDKNSTNSHKFNLC